MNTAIRQDLPVTDLMDPDLIRDPFPRFAELRHDAPISLVTSPLVRGTAYLATRYDDVMAMHVDHRFSNDMQRHAGRLLRLAPKTFRLLTSSMVFKDDPEHKRLRSLVSKAFTPRRIQEMDDMVVRTVDELVGSLRARSGPVELMETFAVRLPLTVIAEMLGVSRGSRRVSP